MTKRGGCRTGEGHEALGEPAVGDRGAEKCFAGWLVMVDISTDESSHPASVITRFVDVWIVQTPLAGRQAVTGQGTGKTDGNLIGTSATCTFDDRIEGVCDRRGISGECLI